MAARKRASRPPKGGERPGPFATALALLVLRLYAGAFFVSSAWWKLVEPGMTVGAKIAWYRDTFYPSLVQRAIDHPPHVLGLELGFYGDFLEHVMLPLRGIAAPALLFFELVLGTGLLLGFGVRLLAGLGFLMMLAFSLAKPQDPQAVDAPVGVFLLTVHHANWPLTWILLAVALLAAGRVLGLDAWVRRRAAPWWRWIG